MSAIFRIENQTTMQGLWYDKDGNFNPFITRLSNAKNKDLPMDFDDTYSDGGHAWFSGCADLAQMREWFYMQDVIELSQAGYHLYRFNVSEFRSVPGHIIFTRSSVIDSAKIAISLLQETK